jgi:hypothetical protein
MTALVGNLAAWNADNNFTHSLPLLVPPRPGASPQGHLVHSILSPWPPDGWPKTRISHMLAYHLLHLLDQLVNEILRGDWAPRLAHPARYGTVFCVSLFGLLNYITHVGVFAATASAQITCCLCCVNVFITLMAVERACLVAASASKLLFTSPTARCVP